MQSNSKRSSYCPSKEWRFAFSSNGLGTEDNKKKVRFTKKQTEFLTEQFQKGEISGQKSDPQEVSKAMSLARDQAGQHRFQPDEVLTSQQISGFFSRLSAKKRLEVTAAGNEAKASEVSEVAMESADEDEISAEAESHLSAVCKWKMWLFSIRLYLSILTSANLHKNVPSLL